MQKERYQNQRNAGFTLAELLVVIGILSVLLTIGMLSVHIYIKNLKMTEMDATAKQIFIAAQNHMTALKSSGKWESYQNKSDMLKGDIKSGLGKLMEKPSDYPTEQSWSNSEIGTEGTHHYYVVGHMNEDDDLSQSILEQLLPQNTIDDIVRNHGKYVIEYDYATATVYGVFYTDSTEDFSYENDIMGANGLDGQGGRQNNQDGKKTRKEYKNSSGKNVMIGYYGGATSTVLSSKTLKEPKIKVDNGERLIVTITDSNDSTDETHMELEILGEESGAIKQVQLSQNKSDSWWSVSVNRNRSEKVYQLVLDDITKKGGHFADIFEGFIPGEDILITATCSSNKVLANLSSSQASTNSLFANKTQVINTTDTNASYAKATIQNGRHLQNLSPDISGLPVQAQVLSSNSSNKSNMTQIATESIVKEVEQTSDIDWNEFWNQIESSKHIYLYNKQNSSAEQSVEEQAFYPISNRAIRLYEGFGKTIVNLTVTDLALTDAEQANSGMFAEIGNVNSSQELKIQNLVLQDISCVGTKNTGVLLGEAKQNIKFEVKNVEIINPNLQAGKSAGGVLGKAQGNANIQINGVQVVDPSIQSQEDSGGLVGTMLSGTIVKSGVFFTDDEEKDGMTASEKYKEGAYSEETKKYGAKYLIASSQGNAGGLVGSLEQAGNIKQSFASVPILAENGNAGGLIGENKGNRTWVTNSYSGGYTEEGFYTQSYSVAASNIDSGTAGGLLGRNTGANVTIQNSYANGSVFGKQIGGFVGSDESDSTVYLNCYATGLVTESTTEGAVRGAFAGQLLTQKKMKNCYYLMDSNKNMEGVGKGTDTSVGKSYEELQKNVTFEEVYNDSGRRITPTVSDDKTETHAYDVFYTEETYPFPVVTTTGYQGDEESPVRTHYGDWPKKQEIARDGFEIGFVYYELLEDKNGNPDDTFYYHGWGGFQSDSEYDESNYMEIFTEGENLVNGLSREPDTYVREEGYVLLVREDVDINDLTVSINGQRSEAKSSFVKKEIDISKDFEGYVAYEFQSQSHFSSATPEVVFGVPTDQYNPVWGPLTKKVGFILNPLFGDSISLITQPADANQYQIRSARHLANMASGTSLVNNAQSNFIQTMDIDLNRKVNGKKEDVNTISSFNATYRSKHYPSIEGNYKIVGLKTTLFGTIGFQGSVINMTLLDVDILTGNKSQLFADLNQGMVKNLTIKNANLVNSSNIDGVVRENQSGTLDNLILDEVYFKSSGYVNGFLNTNNNGKINNIKMSNVEVETQGKVNGFLEQSYGKIENISISGLSVQTQSDINGFIHYNNGNTIDKITMKRITLNTSAKINGFLEQNEGKISSITMSNIMMSNESSLNGFVSSNNGGTITGITINGMKLISKSNVNGFLSYSGGAISSVHITGLSIESDKAVNGFIENNNGSSLTDIVISNLSISSKTVANGFVKNNSGTLKGIQILSLDMRGEETANGFVETNSYQGVIESSVIHPKNPSKTAYQNVMLKGNIVIGFVNQNQGSIKNSYIVGSFEGKDKVSGFVHTNTGTIAASYVNGIITANQIASGFLLYNNSGEISNSFVVGEVSAKNEGGYAAGFVYEHTQKYAGTYKKCYTALWNLSATNIYKFGFVHSGSNVNESFWLGDTKVTGNEVSPPSGESWDRFEVKASPISYSELVQKASGNPEFVTHKYNSGILGTDTANTTYPFAVVSDSNVYKELEFWGDWPSAPSETKVGFIYYEMIEDKVYYNGYLVSFVEDEVLRSKEIMTEGYESTNGLLNGSQKSVTDSGYIILVEEGKQLPNLVQMTSDSTDILSLKKSDIIIEGNEISNMNSYTMIENIETSSNLVRTLRISLESSQKLEKNEKIYFSFIPEQTDSIIYKE